MRTAVHSSTWHRPYTTDCRKMNGARLVVFIINYTTRIAQFVKTWIYNLTFACSGYTADKVFLR